MCSMILRQFYPNHASSRVLRVPLRSEGELGRNSVLNKQIPESTMKCDNPKCNSTQISRNARYCSRSCASQCRDHTKRIAASHTPEANLRRIKTKKHNRWYGLKKKFPHHWVSFERMHEVKKLYDIHVAPEFDFTTRGFISFIRYLGPVPAGMTKPTRGRINHNIGYVRGNFQWQSLSDNVKEVHSRK